MAEQLVKIHFTLAPQEWHGHDGEFLWAAPVNNAPEQFRIMNSPYFTLGVSYGDVVKAVSSRDDNVFKFEEVIERSGHSTYMLIVELNPSRYATHWKMLEQMGCSHESMTMNFNSGPRHLLSVDVPPAANIFEVYKVLKKGEADGVWAFQEGFAFLPKK